MSDQPPASVAALIAQWRAEAKEQRALAIDWPGYRRSYYADGKAQALEVCARDVEALIGRLPVAQCNLDGDCKCEMCRRAREQTLAAWQQRRAGVSLPVPQEHLRAAFAAGFHWAMDGHDKYGEYLGGPIEDGFELFVKSWAGVSLPVDPQESDQ
jgi:hypothetical protein